MMKQIFLIVSSAALLASTTYASAQVYSDPPGYALRRGAIDVAGRARGYYGGYYSAYGAYPYGAYQSYGYASQRYRYWRPDDPPGSRFQDIGNDEEMGIDPFR
jgi:hypothetical protein